MWQEGSASNGLDLMALSAPTIVDRFSVAEIEVRSTFTEVGLIPQKRAPTLEDHPPTAARRFPMLATWKTKMRGTCFNVRPGEAAFNSSL